MQLIVSAQAQRPIRLADVAERYVRLVLAVGQHDADYVDAYYGPPELAEGGGGGEAVRSPRSTARAAALVADVGKSRPLPPAKTMPSCGGCASSISSGSSRRSARASAMLQGKQLTLRRGVAGAVRRGRAAAHRERSSQAILAKLEARLPGEGPLIERYETFKQAFVIPRDRLDRVFQAAIRACRDRTRQYVELPPSESFTVEYVTGKSWSGYNWYQGNYRSLIQVNTDLPIYIDRAIDLACHEGYPGHHVYNVLLEKNLVRDRGWIEFTVYPLFSPQSLIAEGTANYGIEVAFTQAERLAFERDVLFPLAGLDAPACEGVLRGACELVDQLSYAGNEAARRYLDGQIDREGGGGVARDATR